MNTFKIFIVSLAKVLVYFFIVAFMTVFLTGPGRIVGNWKGSDRAKVSRVLNDLRTMRTGIEAYAVDHGEFPAMTWAERFKLGQGNHLLFGTLHPKGPETITTPVAYLYAVPGNPFNMEGAPKKMGPLYLYWNLKQYRELLAAGHVGDFPGPFPYAPKSEKVLDTFERELGDYVFWGVGPGGWEPFLEEGLPIFMPYDPTNGTNSPGAIFISKRLNGPGWVDYEALAGD